MSPELHKAACHVSPKVLNCSASAAHGRGCSRRSRGRCVVAVAVPAWSSFDGSVGMYQVRALSQDGPLVVLHNFETEENTGYIKTPSRLTLKALMFGARRSSPC